MEAERLDLERIAPMDPKWLPAEVYTMTNDTNAIGSRLS